MLAVITQSTGIEVEEIVIEVPIEQEPVDLIVDTPPPQPTNTPPPMVSVADIEESTPMVEMTLALPISAENFDQEAQTKFRMAVGAAAGVDIDKVFILEIKEISQRRQDAGIEVRSAIQTENQEQAQLLAGTLTEESLNNELEQVGLPSATMVSAPKVTSSDNINCESYSTCKSVVTYVKVQIKENKKMAAGFVVLIVFGVLVALAVKYHLYTRYVHPKLFPKDEIEDRDDEKSAKWEALVVLSDVKKCLGMEEKESLSEEESETDEIDIRLHERFGGRISNRTEHAVRWWRFVGISKAFESWVIVSRTSKKHKAKLDRCECQHFENCLTSID